MYDIAIVGAGPAGASAARRLAGRYRILLIDRRPLDRPHVPGAHGKPCGGLLAPDAQRELARDGLGLPDAVAVGPQLFCVRAHDLDAGLSRTYQRFYINTDREAFDRWLVSLVPASVDRVFGVRVTSVDVSRLGAFLRFTTSNGGVASVAARLVVGADGANSLVRRLLCPGPLPVAYRALQATFDGRSHEHAYGAYWSRSLSDWYGWSIPKGDGVVVGIALPPTGTRAAFERFVELLGREGVVTGGERDRQGTTIWRPVRGGHVDPGAPGVVLLGEAAGLVSPSSAEGISYALRSARALDGALADGLEGASERYRDACAPLALDVLGRVAKSTVVHAAWSRRLVMRSGVGALGEPAGSPVPSPVPSS